MSGPLFTIALPVRNGGVHLHQCVESVLAQRYGDFELAILDNASTDGTTEWLRTLRDERVRLYPATQGLSITDSWARIKTIPKKEFLTTIGHDDLLDPSFLEIIADLIRAHPKAGLYCTHFRLIDGEGKFLRHCRPMPGRETAEEFLAARLCDLRDSFGTGHVLRSATYDAIGGIPAYPGLLYADDSLWLQTMVHAGPRITSPEEAFSYRYHAASAARTTLMPEYFDAVESYWDSLESLAQQDAAISRELTRYGPTYVLLFGRGYWQRILEDRILRSEAANPLTEQRLGRFLARAGLTIQDLQRADTSHNLARLARAAQTRTGRMVYRHLTKLRMLRRSWQFRHVDTA